MDTTNIGRFGAWMAEARTRWGWSRATIEERSGVSDVTQRAIEQGERTNVQDRTLDGLTRAFGIDRNQLLAIMDGEQIPVPAYPPADDRNQPDHDGQVWDELTDLRRRLVESETRTQINLDEFRRVLDRALTGLAEVQAELDRRLPDG